MAETLGELPERAKVHLDRGYDSRVTRERLEERGLLAEVSQKGRPAALAATLRWVVVERTNSWHNAHKKLAWCTERQGRVIDFWVAFSEVVIIVRRLIREAWVRYRWETPSQTMTYWRKLLEAGAATVPRPLVVALPYFSCC